MGIGDPFLKIYSKIYLYLKTLTMGIHWEWEKFPVRKCSKAPTATAAAREYACQAKVLHGSHFVRPSEKLMKNCHLKTNCKHFTKWRQEYVVNPMP
jgi:hypothetical protein